VKFSRIANRTGSRFVVPRPGLKILTPCPDNSCKIALSKTSQTGKAAEMNAIEKSAETICLNVE
jgi:hypothetical protein